MALMHTTVRAALVAVELFIGVGAVYGVVMRRYPPLVQPPPVPAAPRTGVLYPGR